MKNYRADLHIHTGLSPCGDYGMYPSAIVARAVEEKLDIIAICDHNSSANVQAVSAAGKRAGITVFGGMEVCSDEEIHFLTLFEDPEDLRSMDREISGRIAEKNDPSIFGEQILFDGDDRILGVEDSLLISSCGFTIEEIADLTRKYCGLLIPSHVNRDSYGLLGVLGYIPRDINFDALELTAEGFSGWEELYDSSLPEIHSSDAHYLEQIGSGFTIFQLERPTLSEVEMALKGLNGRKVVV